MKQNYLKNNIKYPVAGDVREKTKSEKSQNNIIIVHE
jgi:hypothetical protein